MLGGDVDEDIKGRQSASNISGCKSGVFRFRFRIQLLDARESFFLRRVSKHQ